MMSEQSNHSKKIAVVGVGVAGLTAAYLLQHSHQITIFEKNNYLGGHTNTITITEGDDAGTAVDTGFIVLNNQTYPNFHQLLKRLSIPIRKSDMSFSYYDEISQFQYAGTGINGLFAQRKNIFNPRFYGLLKDILTFGRTALKDLVDPETAKLSLGEYFAHRRFSKTVIDQYFIPMGAAIWSTPAQQMLEFPALTFLRFFHNHGLLTLKNMPIWQTVVGGSHQYVQAFKKQFTGIIYTNTEIKGIERLHDKVWITSKTNDNYEFDHVIIATHADEALILLLNPTSAEQRFLGAWSYNTNHTILHTDSSVMPPLKRAWASWNYVKEKDAQHNSPLSLTYDMNRLQGLQTRKNYFVTLNTSKIIDQSKIIKEIIYKHPMYTFDAINTQEQLRTLNGKNNISFCGSYFYNGFHEDAVKSAIDVTRQFGVEL